MQLLCISLTILAALALGSGYAATLPTSAPSVFSSDPNPNSNTNPNPGAEFAAGSQSFSDSDLALPAGSIDFGAAVAPSPVVLTSGSSEVTPCSLSSSDLNECIRGLIQTFAGRLRNQGVPEYNMDSIDPYFYKRGIFRYTNDGIQGGLLIKNMEIYGISHLQVNTVAANFTENGFVIKLGVELPQLKAGGHFKADVKFGGLRLVPKGPFNITIDNIKATILTDGHIEQLPSGQQRLSLHRLNANVNIGDAKVVANGIFSDRNLNAMILNLVNENLPEITRVGIPATREQWAPILIAHINEFFAKVPIEKFLVQ